MHTLCSRDYCQSMKKQRPEVKITSFRGDSKNGYQVRVNARWISLELSKIDFSESGTVLGEVDGKWCPFQSKAQESLLELCKSSKGFKCLPYDGQLYPVMPIQKNQKKSEKSV